MMVHLPPGDYAKVLVEMWRVTKKALMIGFFGNAVDTNKECIYGLNPVNPQVGYNIPTTGVTILKKQYKMSLIHYQILTK